MENQGKELRSAHLEETSRKAPVLVLHKIDGPSFPTDLLKTLDRLLGSDRSAA